MQFLKFVKLRKYVNGIATGEYKKGDLLDVVDFPSKLDCELSTSVTFNFDTILE